jgi:transcriptional regulator with XRE-family HTH domain
MTETEKLGLFLTAIRKQKGMSQEELAEITGLKRPNISKIEKGVQSPTYETLAPILKALDLVIIPIDTIES